MSTRPSWKQLSSDLGDDLELAREIARTLCDSWTSLHERLQNALVANDGIETARSLHAIKGALGVFPSNGFAARLKPIETQFRQGERGLAELQLEKTLPELQSYIESLEELCSKADS